MEQRIFDPLGMTDTFFYPSEGNTRLATLYERVDGDLRKAANPAFMKGAYLSGGGLYSTAEDTHFFIDPAERIIGLFMTQIVGLQSRGELRDDFETAVMQSIVGSAAAGTH